jgi:DNA replication protein DnaC
MGPRPCTKQWYFHKRDFQHIMATSFNSQPAPACPVCDGTGWKQIAVPGKASRMTRCDCRISARNQQLLEKAGIPARYQHCALESFSTSFTDADNSLSDALLIAQLFAKEYRVAKQYRVDKTPGPLFWGSYGTGKTHLAVGMLKALIYQGIPSLFYDYRELLKEIQNSYNPNVQVTELEILKPVFESEVLVLDELGAARPTEWVWDAVQYILNTRYNAQLTTIITTNYPFGPETKQQSGEPYDKFQVRKAGLKEEFTLGDRIGDRMVSRLQEMCRIIPVLGVDFRKKWKNASSYRD